MTAPLSDRARRLALPALLASLAAIALGAPRAGAAPGGESVTPYIIGGQESSIAQFPWQVYVLLDDEAEGIEASCGGSILDASHILTAAHCVDHEGTTSSYPAGELLVIAGASEILGFGGPLEDFEVAPGKTFQVKGVKSFRTDPYYTVKPEIKDDVAVLELESPLVLSGEKNTQAIGLVLTGATPPPGTPLSISGYGKEEGAEGEGHNSNGKLYSTSLTAISSDACRGFVGVNSAVLMCAESATSSTCQGDSGGPLTQGSPAVQVGIVDFGAKECPVGKADVFTNVAAPEVRVFIEGSESPPVAARPTSAPALKAVGAVPVELSPLTCEPGGWSGSPTFTYTFETETAAKTVLQSGTSNVLLPAGAAVGSPLVCIVQAVNAGGVSTSRSGTTAPLALDTAPPVSSITSLPRCHVQSCTLAIAAFDPNAVALSVGASAAYSVIAKCPSRKGRKPPRGRVCHKTKTVAMSVAGISPGVYQASASKLPYGEQIKFSVLATDAAGVRQSAAAVAAVTLHKPKPKKRKRR
jgi:Trypsin